MVDRKCPECGRSFEGRSDKKFCTDACRNAFNNRQRGPLSNAMRNVNNVLSKNRRILERHNVHGKTKTHRDQLVREGFNFNYFTNIYRNRTGDEYRFCYEQGYLDTGSGYLLLVKNEDYLTKS